MIPVPAHFPVTRLPVVFASRRCGGRALLFSRVGTPAARNPLDEGGVDEHAGHEPVGGTWTWSAGVRARGWRPLSRHSFAYAYVLHRPEAHPVALVLVGQAAVVGLGHPGCALLPGRAVADRSASPATTAASCRLRVGTELRRAARDRHLAVPDGPRPRGPVRAPALIRPPPPSESAGQTGRHPRLVRVLRRVHVHADTPLAWRSTTIGPTRSLWLPVLARCRFRLGMQLVCTESERLDDLERSARGPCSPASVPSKGGGSGRLPRGQRSRRRGELAPRVGDPGVSAFLHLARSAYADVQGGGSMAEAARDGAGGAGEGCADHGATRRFPVWLRDTPFNAPMAELRGGPVQEGRTAAHVPQARTSPVASLGATGIPSIQQEDVGRHTRLTRTRGRGCGTSAGLIAGWPP